MQAHNYPCELPSKPLMSGSLVVWSMELVAISADIVRARDRLETPGKRQVGMCAMPAICDAPVAGKFSQMN